MDTNWYFFTILFTKLKIFRIFIETNLSIHITQSYIVWKIVTGEFQNVTNKWKAIKNAQLLYKEGKTSYNGKELFAWIR